MTITVPRDIPDIRGRTPFARVTFDPVYNQVVAPTNGGRVQVANVGPDLWKMYYETRPLAAADALELAAWLQSLRGGARFFKAWHPLRRYPAGYRAGFGTMTRAGGGAFDGTATLAAIGVSRDTVTLSTLPAGLALTAGDMMSVPMGDSRALLRVITGGVANGAGSLTLDIEPIVPLAVVTGVAVDLVKPWCFAVLDAASVSIPLSTSPGPVSFSAWQSY